MATYTQANRLLAINTPLGEDKLIVRRFTGREGISQLFHFRLDLVSEDAGINFKDLVGKNVSFAVKLLDMTKGRYFNGYVSRFAQLPGTLRLAHYEMEVVPWLWFLTRTSDCRIFQDKSVPEIIEQVFKDHGFSDYEMDVRGTHNPWTYCVQYRETAFAFVSRLMEQEGIFYFFKHENGKHTLVLSDSQAAHQACPEQSRVLFERGGGRGYNREEDTVFSWHYEHRLRTGKYSVTDYNFETPSTSLMASLTSTIDEGGNQKLEFYDFPGEHTTKAAGDQVARICMEEEEAGHTIITGESNVRAFVSGYKFQISEYPRQDQNGEYILTEVVHRAEEGGFYSGEGSVTDATYDNAFTAIPADVTFRPPRVTPKPSIDGPQTAFVVGPGGEEIHVDKYGRVKVQFHWDRRATGDDKSSCWMRVSQPWAGKNWGAVWIPRIGQEVIVDFLEGDPDRPIITGRVYNAESMPPYALPDNNTMSTFKSYSSKGGGGFNELRFEDKKGDEQIFMHAEKNLDTRVKNDLYEWIGRERHLIVKKDQFEEVENDRHTKIKNNDHTEVMGDQHLTVTGKVAAKIGGTLSLAVTGNVAEEFRANHSVQVTQNCYLKALQMVIEASTGLTLKVGGNYITIDPSGVTIKGTMVTVDSNMIRLASGSGSPALSGSAGSLVSPTAPTKPEEADTADPGQMAKVKARQHQEQSGKYGKVRLAPFVAPSVSQSAAPQQQQEAQQKNAWIEIAMVDEEGKPVPGEPYRVVLPDGQTAAEGTLDENGRARVAGFEPGNCQVTFPNLDKEAWRKK